MGSPEQKKHAGCELSTAAAWLVFELDELYEECGGACDIHTEVHTQEESIEHESPSWTSHKTEHIYYGRSVPGGIR